MLKLSSSSVVPVASSPTDLTVERLVGDDPGQVRYLVRRGARLIASVRVDASEDREDTAHFLEALYRRPVGVVSPHGGAARHASALSLLR